LQRRSNGRAFLFRLENMRIVLLMMVALGALAQNQQPRYQAGWPCTGKERAFDPTYSRIAEATGGHLFLFDKSEVAGTSALAIGDARHKETIMRGSGKLESYVDIPVPVDASIDSLFVVASLQCMQTIQLYDPQRSGVTGDADADHWFRAGRIVTIVKPTAGEWLLRLAGTGAYSVAVQAHAAQGLHGVEVREKKLSLRVSPEIASPQFRLVGPAGEAIQALALEPDPDSPGHFGGAFEPAAKQFRVLVEDGAGFQRVDPRLFAAKPVQ
jgi:hypothetical protein